MEITEIERFIGVCGCKAISRTEKGETLDVVGNLMELHKCTDRFNRVKYDYETENGCDPIKAYDKVSNGSLEDSLARFAIFIFSLANSYRMNVQSLREDGSRQEKNFDDFIYSLLKISMSHYRSCKKIIILIGMLCGYCEGNNIDLGWFVEKRLSAGFK